MGNHGFKRWIGRAASVVLGCLVFGSTAVASAGVDDLAARPRGQIVRVDMPEESLITPMGPARNGAPLVLYMNRCRGGLTVQAGAADSSINNVSSILDQTATFPEYPFGDASWNNLVTSVQAIFAPFNIVVTDQDPGNTPHDEAIVCGSNTHFGIDGAAGVAPGTCAPILNAITYTFPEVIGDDHRFTVETIAQEAAHAWGLDHSFKCEDPMTYLLECGDKSFQDGDFACGEYEARDCYCGGATQNTVQFITELFGSGAPDVQPPTAAIATPQDGATFSTQDSFDITLSVGDDVGVARVALHTDGVEAAEDGSDPFEGWSITEPPVGDHEFYIVVTDFAGNETISEAITVHVTEDGSPDGGASGGSSGDDEGDEDDEADPDADDDGDDDGDSEEEEEDEVPGGIPVAPYPTGSRGDANGCGCQADTQGAGGGLVVLSLLALGLVAPRRRRY